MSRWALQHRPAGRHWPGIAVVIAVALMSSTVLGRPVRAEPGDLVVDNAGGNGAVQGSTQPDPRDSSPGRTLIAVKNMHAYWTNVEVTTIGVQLEPETVREGGATLSGVYAAVRSIGPGGTAVWHASFDPGRPSQVAVRVTPSIFAETGGLSAALNILNIAIHMLPGNHAMVARKGLDYAKALQDAALLIQNMMGDKLAEDFTREGIVSGRLARDIFDVLSDPLKVNVLLEAFDLVGVKASKDVLKKLTEWSQIVPLLACLFHGMAVEGVVGR